MSAKEIVEIKQLLHGN